MVFDRSYRDDAGIIDEHIHAAEPSRGLVDEPLGVVLPAQIRGDSKQILLAAHRAGFQQLPPRIVELNLAAGGNNDSRASAAKLFGQRQAESSRPAGNDNDLSTRPVRPPARTLGNARSDCKCQSDPKESGIPKQ
jgi:hypothetical protein